MEFFELAKKVKDRFGEIANSSNLYSAKIKGSELWNIYLSSFKPENNPVFRDPNSSSHNCNLDEKYFNNYGNVVGFDENLNIITQFDFPIDKDDKYYDSITAVKNALLNSSVGNVFLEKFDLLHKSNFEKTNPDMQVYKLYNEKNYKIYNQAEADMFGVVTAGKTYTFYHFYAELPRKFVDFSSKSIEAILGEKVSFRDVLNRGLSEIGLDTLELVNDLIKQGSLLDGEQYQKKLTAFINLKRDYDKVPTTKRENFVWERLSSFPYPKFRNELIGVLCVELSQGVELNKACKDWNKRVDPVNYMKTSAPITQRQINEAKKFTEDNGYVESFDRRFATIDDIRVDEIIHTSSVNEPLKTASIFDSVTPSKNTRHKRSEFDGVEEITIEKFMKDILPSCTSVEAFVDNRFKSNFVALTTSNNVDSKPMFKWTNNFSWTYNGNLAGASQIKEAVKSAGGAVDGVLRFSISWNEGGKDIVDFDAHALEPTGIEINFSTHKGMKTPSTGMLDVDMRSPREMGVENITWIDKAKMKDGQYQFWVKNFDGGKAPNGFKAEIEFEGETYSYVYKKSTSSKEVVKVATVTLKNGKFTIVSNLSESEVVSNSSNVWGIDTNNFHKVNLVALSPNHWGENEVGNKHYFFMLDKCASDAPLRGFHNENLNSDLLSHKKVMEVLGNTMKIEPTKKQLAGLGFNATVRDELIVKVSGSFKRTLKIKF